MRVIHVLRKPCSEGAVAANVLRHGTGALNIDASRVGTAADVPSVHATRKSDYPQSYTGNGAGWGRTRGGYAGDEVHWEPKGGRWPANLVLQHLDGCRCEGTKEVKPPNGSGRAGAGSLGFQTLYVGGVAKGAGFAGGSVKTDGTETVAAWSCEPGCPVTALDTQSGVSKSTGGRIGNAQGAYANQGRTGWGTGHTAGDPGFGDVGGASRFFRQVGGKGEP
jgi:hypothetical protein